MKIYNIHNNKNFRLKKSGKSRKKSDSSQLPLFQTTVHQLKTGGSPFEEALRLDEIGDPCAKEYYLRAIEEQENVADSHSNLGILESTTDRVKAFGYFLNALKVNPGHCEAHFNMANLYFEEKDFRLARLHYEIAAQADPAFPNIYFNLALVCIELDDLAKAEENLKLYINLVGKNRGQDAVDILEQIHKFK
jgi:tetratricopeptide (TPR) repeat protein